jgi:hypothetical protein
LIRLQDETARVEDYLVRPESLEALLKCFVTAKANSFENLLDPFLKICRISNDVTIGIAKSQFFKRVIDRLGHSKAVVRLNLLRIVRAVCEVHPNRAILVERYGIYEIVAKLSKDDGAVLVRELAREIKPTLAPALMPSLSGKSGVREGGGLVVGASKYKKKSRRAASETSTSLSPVLLPVPSGSGGSSGARDVENRSGGSGSGVRLSRHKLNDIQWQHGAGRGS